MEIYTTKLSEIMTREVKTLKPTNLLRDVNDIFTNSSFHHIPILNDDAEVVGIVSRSDYLLLLDSMTFLKKNFDQEINNRLFDSLMVSDFMTKQLATLKDSDPLMKAAAMFKENRFHAIPILTENKKFAGIVTTFDLLNFAYKDLAMKVKDYS